ncbi:MAG: tetratricopeptide repeat protein [Puniceicoccales bacterium]|jgi:tetratricopeptide (TPR) repeat protein|nr:tetratricopeptide repeat protein [Puniceicoccales bacterium]
MWYRKSKNRKSRAVALAFLWYFYQWVYGEYTFSWDSQIDAIRILADCGNLHQAEEAGKVLLKGIDGNLVIPFLELLGEICLRGKHYRKAADYYLQASQSIDNEKETLRYLIIAADAYYRNGDYDLAAAIYDECYHKDGDEEVLFRYGCALLHSENFEKLGSIIFKKEQLQARLDWNCATCWNHKGNFERALTYLEPWIRRGIHDVKHYYFYAQMQYRLGRISEALWAISLGKMIHLNGITAETIPLWELQMRLNWERGNFEGAQKIEQMLCGYEGIDLKKILLWKVRGVQKLGDREITQRALEELATHDKGSAEFIGGEIDFAKGNFSKSLEHFKSAENSGSRIRHAAQYREGKIEAYVGNFRKAVAIYEQLSNDISTGNSREEKHAQEFLESALQRTRLAVNQST